MLMNIELFKRNGVWSFYLMPIDSTDYTATGKPDCLVTVYDWVESPLAVAWLSEHSATVTVEDQRLLEFLCDLSAEYSNLMCDVRHA